MAAVLGAVLLFGGIVFYGTLPGVMTWAMLVGFVLLAVGLVGAVRRGELHVGGGSQAAVAAAGLRDELADLIRSAPAVLVRTYPGRTQADAAEAYRAEATRLAAVGYVVASQSWAEGRPGVGRVVAIGLLASSIRPPGALTVTYQRTLPATPTPVPATKVCPRCAEDVKVAAAVCRYCGHEFLPTAEIGG